MARRHTLDAATLAEGVLAGERYPIACAISHIENETEQSHAILSRVYAQTGRAHIVGVTGAPGTGKSTLVTALTQSYRSAGCTVAIVAIDPSSPFTGGALLGDRVRMAALSGDNGVFIRSMATRGSLGGLSKTTADAVALLDAAGFDRILVETVGVGQAEVEIASTAHTTLVVEAPGMGDEVQAIKAGILEIGDVLVVNKADRAGADRTARALEMMLEIGNSGVRQISHHGHLLRVDGQDLIQEQGGLAEGERWQVPVMKTIAASNAGVDDLRLQIEAHVEWLRDSGELSVREQVRVAHVLENILRAELNRRLQNQLPQQELANVMQRVYRREVDPYSAAAEIVRRL
jgi:LAO/AO transport system kinase